MKVQCDVCERAQATLLCCADEASLCAECDKRVHAANKLAGKHQRVPLLYPAPEELPCCDICQDKTGYFFCLEDRALLCRNCDFSIHSANAWAAKHKRFLVSGIRVALQVMSSIDTAENPQACSPSQVSSPATQVSNHLSPQGSQLSSSTTQTNHLSTSRIPRVQKPSRMTPTSVVPSYTQETSQIYGKAIRDEPLSSLPQLSSIPQQNQTEVTLPVAEQGRNTMVVDPFSTKGVGASVSTTLPPPTLNQQFFFNGGRPQATWGMRSDVDLSAQDLSRGQMLTNQRSVGGGISEYLTEAIPGWRVDEIFNLPDMDGSYNSGSAKTFALNVDVDWPTESSGSEDLGAGAALAEVPSIPSPPTASGVTGSLKRWGLDKSLKEPDLDCFLHCDDTLVVPDIGGVESPTTASLHSHSQKRRRSFIEL